jgi:ABC-2 type transport system ATP-binding protein
MTVAGYLRFVAEIKQVPPAKRPGAVEEAVRVAGLESVRGRLIKNISRGFKQRVGVAQALIDDPQVLILDEPTIGLDPAQIIEIRSLIRSLKKKHTIILSTHILQEVTQTCDGAVIINEGRLMASGSLEGLTASFKDRDGVVLKLRRASTEAASLLKKVPGVESVERTGNEYRLEWAKGRPDLRDDITRLIVDKDLGLLEMRPAGLSIEDLYLKVVSGGPVQ